MNQEHFLVMGNSNSNSGGTDYRDFLDELSSGWHRNPNCFDGFLTATQIGVLDVMIKNINRDKDSVCSLSLDELVLLTDLSDSTIKRIIKQLTELGIIEKKLTNKTAIKQFNQRGIKLLDDIVSGQDMWTGAFLRQEMQSKNVKSVFDITDEMVAIARKRAEEKYKSNISDRSQRPLRENSGRPDRSQRPLRNGFGQVTQTSPNNKENNIKEKKIQVNNPHVNVMSIFERGQEYTREEHLKKRKKTIRKA